MVFDLLAVEGLPVSSRPYAERRALLETLDLEGPHVRLVARFDEGQTLYDAVVEGELEGVVAKRLRDAYRPRERGWVKTKKREAPRYREDWNGARRNTRV